MNRLTKLARWLLVMLTVLGLAVSSAPGASLSVGRAPHPNHAAHRVWVWKNVWNCRAYLGSTSLTSTLTFSVIQLDGGYLLCVWIPSHWAWTPMP